jgi:PRC-barrel domain
MTRFLRLSTAPVLAAEVLLAVGPWPALAQEVALVTVDVKAVAKGYRVSELMGDDVMNERNEGIGTIDDLATIRNHQAVFVAVEVGGFLSAGGQYRAPTLRWGRSGAGSD